MDDHCILTRGRWIGYLLRYFRHVEMKKHITAFKREFFAVVIACVAGSILIAKYVLEQNVPLSFWIALAFISIATYVIFNFLINANKNKRPQVFVNYFMASLTAKLLGSAFLLLAVGLIDRANLKFTAIAFFIAYALLSFVELKNLVPFLKNSNH